MVVPVLETAPLAARDDVVGFTLGAIELSVFEIFELAVPETAPPLLGDGIVLEEGTMICEENEMTLEEP